MRGLLFSAFDSTTEPAPIPTTPAGGDRQTIDTLSESTDPSNEVRTAERLRF